MNLKEYQASSLTKQELIKEVAAGKIKGFADVSGQMFVLPIIKKETKPKTSKKLIKKDKK